MDDKTGAADPLWILTHIPKTAGLTVTRTLTAAFGAERCLVADGVGDLRAFRERGRSLDDLAYLGGHVTLPEIHRTLGLERRAYRAVALVREPVERAVSLFLFLKRVKNAIPHVSEAIEGRDFAYFFDYLYDTDDLHLHNMQCQYLGGAESFERARRAVETRYALVGCTEHFPLFFRPLAAAIGPACPSGWEAFASNVAPVAAAAADVQRGLKPADLADIVRPAVRRRIERTNAADMQLHRHIVETCGGLHVSAALLRGGASGPAIAEAGGRR
ncbi:MAG TPA: sulfotransferase family 2 domain-containing protein [Alphaproteobacteria bacterium]|nr:sulfotransferase family 2 domain-containing protein [Alphaproteobacteria bacterium]